MREPATARRGFSTARLVALVRKESVQVVRDPAAILIAFVLPVVMLFLFAYAVSLDLRRVPIGVVLESEAATAQSLAAAFSASRYFEVTPARDRRELEGRVVSGELAGYVVIPQDLDRRLRGGGEPWVQIVTDGAQPNTANFVASYARGVIGNWQAQNRPSRPGLSLAPRFWFNPELESRRALVPGAIAIVMTMIGTLLTALVVAREWERGTMEAILSTPATINEILLGKLLPYFVLGLVATLGSALIAVTLFQVPLRGSWWALVLMSALFLVPALGQGLLISALTRNQFIAAQAALLSGFLPAFLLSGFLYEIDSMPAPVQAITRIVAARYFVDSLTTLFLAGNVWRLLIPNGFAMLAIGAVFFGLARLRTRKSLEN